MKCRYYIVCKSIGIDDNQEGCIYYCGYCIERHEGPEGRINCKECEQAYQTDECSYIYMRNWRSKK